MHSKGDDALDEIGWARLDRNRAAGRLKCSRVTVVLGWRG